MNSITKNIIENWDISVESNRTLLLTSTSLATGTTRGASRIYSSIVARNDWGGCIRDWNGMSLCSSEHALN